MKKQLIIAICLFSTISIGAFTYQQQKTSVCKDADKENFYLNKENYEAFNSTNYLGKRKKFKEMPFVYSISSRFNATITPEKIAAAKTIRDLYPAEATNGIGDLFDVKIALLSSNGEEIELNNEEQLTSKQKALLQSATTSMDFYIIAKHVRKATGSSYTWTDELVYYMTIVPEQVAEYEKGMPKLVEYLKSNSINDTYYLDEKKLQPGRIFFVVNEQGKINEVQMESTSGYTHVDENMLHLIKTMPGTWKPAKNTKGENVCQKFVFFYGIEGC